MEAIAWVGFVAFVLLLLAFDLFVVHREAHVIRLREALSWTAFYVTLALLFTVVVYFGYENHWLGLGTHEGSAHSGKEAAVQYFTGWLLEESLSLDNLFVIAVIQARFGVPASFQHRLLFWGILGALVMRGIMIGAGAVLIQRFDWMVYVFGAVLLVTAVRLLVTQHERIEPDRNVFVRLVKRFVPVTEGFHGTNFFVHIDGRRVITPMFLALIVIETADVAFAVDSIPAIFAVTSDPFLVFTSNVFAILGLRSLYFALSGMLERFKYLKSSLVFVLAYVGVKMILSHHYPIPNAVSLGVVAGILAVGVVASFVPGKQSRSSRTPSGAAPGITRRGDRARARAASPSAPRRSARRRPRPRPR